METPDTEQSRKIRGISKDDAEMFIEAVVRGITKALNPKIAEIRARIDALEKAPMKYMGTYEPGRAYERNQFVTHAGSVWHCNEATTNRPGEGGPHWVLACKRGLDGKDAR